MEMTRNPKVMSIIHDSKDFDNAICSYIYMYICAYIKPVKLRGKTMHLVCIEH